MVLVHVAACNVLKFSQYNSYFFRTAVVRKLFHIRFSHKHCNFSCGWLLIKTASKTVARSTWKQNMYTTRTLLQRCLSLACLEIRSINEQAINSTRNRIYSLNVFHSLLLDIYFLFVSELI